MPYVGGSYPGPPPPLIAVYNALQGAELSPTMLALAAAVGTGAALETLRRNRHLLQVMTPGHFDRLDQGCIEAIGWDEADVEHVNQHYSAAEKEVFRAQLVVNIIEAKPMLIQWMFRRAHRKNKTVIDDNPDVTVITFEQVIQSKDDWDMRILRPV